MVDSVINSCIYESPLGKLRLVEKKGFLVQVCFTKKIFRTDIPINSMDPPKNYILEKVSNELEKYFSGCLREFDLNLKINGTSFQLSAWRSLLRIPYGETWSYSQQAKYIKKPNAIRAIGKANSKNPIQIIIPCHRVIAKNGRLSGYSGGIINKERLIEFEKGFKYAHKN